MKLVIVRLALAVMLPVIAAMGTDPALADDAPPPPPLPSPLEALFEPLDKQVRRQNAPTLGYQFRLILNWERDLI